MIDGREVGAGAGRHELRGGRMGQGESFSAVNCALFFHHSLAKICTKATCGWGKNCGLGGLGTFFGLLVALIT